MKCFLYLLYFLSAFNKPLAYHDQKPFQSDTTGKHALVNGINIYYEEYGSGEPLLLLHGNSQSVQAFKMQIPEFAKHYRVIAVDTRGHGKSGDDGKRYSYNLFTEDVTALLEHLKIKKTAIVGWSDGGNTGITFAMKHPDKVTKLAVMGANIFIDSSVVDDWVFKELNNQLKELQNDTTQGSKNRVRRINLLLTEPKHSFSDLKTITCPVLVLAGEKDIVKAGHTRTIAKNITKATLVIAPNETHDFPYENPGSFNKLVLDFLKKIN
jgi:pimeloyl-ACP methyl ester carboxylesterase